LDLIPPEDERAGRRLVHDLLHSAKTNVMGRFRRKKGKLLETELYLEWLNELDYVVIALHVSNLLDSYLLGSELSSDHGRPL
jgi:hypothetical protein